MAGAKVWIKTPRAAEVLDWAVWCRWSGCRAQSRVENKLNDVKLLGQSRMASDLDRHVAKLHVRVAEANGDIALDILVPGSLGEGRPETGEAELHLVCATTPSEARRMSS